MNGFWKRSFCRHLHCFVVPTFQYVQLSVSFSNWCHWEVLCNQRPHSWSKNHPKGGLQPIIQLRAIHGSVFCSSQNLDKLGLKKTFLWYYIESNRMTQRDNLVAVIKCSYLHGKGLFEMWYRSTPNFVIHVLERKKSNVCSWKRSLVRSTYES